MTLTLRQVKGTPIANAEYDANVTEKYSAVAHGFAAGDLVYRSSATAWAKAVASAGSTVADGIVVAVPNADTAYINTRDGVLVTKTAHGLGAAGVVVFLHQSSAGAMTTGLSSGIVQRVGKVMDANSILFRLGSTYEDI